MRDQAGGCVASRPCRPGHRETASAFGDFGGSRLPGGLPSTSHAEFAAKLSIVVEEAGETVYWLELLRGSSLMKSERLAKLLQEANELVAIAVSSRKTAKLWDRHKRYGPSLAIVNRQSAMVNSLESQ